MRRLCLLGLLVLALVPLSARQREAARQPDQPIFRSSSTLATIDAVVFDDDGRPVTDLTKDDFEVTVSGKHQELQQAVYIKAGSPVQGAAANLAVTAPSLAPAASSASAALKESHGGAGRITRTIAFVVDDLSLSFESTFYVRHALSKYIETQVAPGDLVAIVRTASGTGALQQFTTDTRLLKMAVDRVQWDFRSRNGVSSFDALSPEFHGPTGTIGTGASVDGLRADYAATGSLGAIEYIARGIEELPGRKSIVLLSEGFPQMFADRLEGGRVWNSMTRMLDEANRAGVVLYTIDARGLQTAGLTAEDNPQVRDWGMGGGGSSGGVGGASAGGGSGSGNAGSGSGSGSGSGATGGGTTGSPGVTGSGAGFLDVASEHVRSAAGDRKANLIDSQESLQFIANQTGGLAVMNTNDLGRAIERVLEDQRGYYLLGYSVLPEKLHAGWNHDGVHVQVKRAHTHVRARQGFFGPASQRDPSQPATDPLLIGLLSPFGASGVSARLMSAFWHDGTKSYVRSLLFFDASDIHFADSAFGDKGAYLELAVLAVDGDGQVTASSRHRLRLSLTPAQYNDALKHGVVFRSRLMVDKPGAYQIRAAVRDLDTGRLGSSSQFLEVPKVGKGRLALSGLLLRGVTADTADTEKDGTIEVSSGLADNALLAPTIRILKPGTKAVYAYEIYNGLGDDAQLQMSTTVLRNGKAVYHTPAAPVAAPTADKKVRVIAIGGALELGSDMPSGPYSLQVDVLRQKKGRIDRRASQWVDFEVRR